jgi:hypothetical protein
MEVVLHLPQGGSSVTFASLAFGSKCQAKDAEVIVIILYYKNKKNFFLP